MEKIVKLIEENRKKDVIINSMHDGLISVNLKEEIEFFNKAAEEIFNLKREEVISRKVTEVIPNTRLHIVLKTGRAEINQIQHTGHLTIISNRVPVIDDNANICGAVAVFRDITDMEKLDKELTSLKEMQVMLKEIINSTQDAISVIDEKGKGILINPAYTHLTGLLADDVIGKPPTVDIAEGESIHLQVLETKKPVTEARMKVGPLGKNVIVNAAPIIVDGELRGSVGVIHDISEIKRLTEELDQARRMIRQLSAKYTFDDIIGESNSINDVKRQAIDASQTPVTVLLRGESGTGKELFAHAIHNTSKRSKFIRVNCSALADNILESELFGYEEGAFTGAKKGGKKGLFEEANGGTIFLDEIGKITLTLQSKLLRVLQEKEITKVGGTKPIDIDVRIIAATNINLEEAIEKDEFRNDLYYRLNVFPIYIPPLRKRKEDIPDLIKHMIRKFNQDYGRSVKGCVPKVIEMLMNYHWPGNVRELENIIGRAMINLGLEGEYIGLKELPLFEEREIKYNSNKVKSDCFEELRRYSLKEIINKTERKAIIKALEETGGNRTAAAELLGIAIRSLYYKMKKYQID